MSEMDVAGEDYPTEIHDYLSAFETSVVSVDEMLKTMMSVSKSELLQKLDPLEQAKLDLVSAYTLNSMFWVYLATQGMNPKEHPVKQELKLISVLEYAVFLFDGLWHLDKISECLNSRQLNIKSISLEFIVKVFVKFCTNHVERIRTYMNRVKEIEDKKKAAKLDKGAASRFVRNALYEPKPQNRNTKKTPVPVKKKKTH